MQNTQNLSEDEIVNELLRRKQATEKMKYYSEYILDMPPARHHQLICDKLDQIVDGKIKNLLICAPPGSAKSTYTSMMLPSFWVAKNSGLVLAASHTAELADEFGRKVRNIINSDAYGRLFPQTRLSPESRAAARWTTTDGGGYFGIGAGGGVSGRRANLLLIDDPYRNLSDARSPTIRKRIQDWFFADAMTRLVPGSPKVLIQTRWHDDDLAGVLLQAMEDGTGEHWDTIILQAICEDPENDPLGRERGEALWPEWQSLDDLITIKKSQPSVSEWNSLYQQHPTNPEGEIVQRSWIRYYDEVPKDRMRIINSWDTAGTVAVTSAYSCCLVIGQVLGTQEYFLLDVYRKKVEFPELLAKIREIYRTTGASACLIEDKATGQSALQILRGSGINTIKVKPQSVGDKEYRFELITPVLHSGRFLLPRNAPWKQDFEDELFSFPKSKYKDQMDSLSQAFKYLEEPRGRRGMAKLSLTG